MSKHGKSAYLNIHLTVFVCRFLAEINAFNQLGLCNTSEATKSILVLIHKSVRTVAHFPIESYSKHEQVL